MSYSLLAEGALFPGGLFAALVDRSLPRSTLGPQGRPASERAADAKHIETA
jgi:hypothetical protein